MSHKHWSDQPPDKSHFFARDGHCKGCMMHEDWQGARDNCTMPYPRPKRRPQYPPAAEVILKRFARIVHLRRTKPRRPI